MGNWPIRNEVFVGTNKTVHCIVGVGTAGFHCIIVTPLLDGNL